MKLCCFSESVRGLIACGCAESFDKYFEVVLISSVIGIYYRAEYRICQVFFKNISKYVKIIAKRLDKMQIRLYTRVTGPKVLAYYNAFKAFKASKAPE